MVRYRLGHYIVFFILSVATPLLGLWLMPLVFPDFSGRELLLTFIVVVGCCGLTSYWFSRRVRSVVEQQVLSAHEDNLGLQSQRASLLRLATSKVLYSGDIDLAIKELTEISAATVKVERVGVWLFDDAMSKVTCLCLYEKSKNRHSSGREVFASIAPRYFEAIRKHRVIVADDVLANPLTNEFAYLSQMGISSMIDAPIYVNGRLFGILCHEHVGSARHWSIEEQSYAVSAADMVAMAFEVHERRKVEGELRRKSLAIEASMEGIAIIERDEGFSFVNPSFARMFGYDSPAELMGQNWKMLYDQYQLKKLERHVFISFRRAGNLQCEAIGTRRDGSTFAQELSLTALGDGGLVCIVRDITQRKEAEQSLTENRKFLRKVIDTDPNFIFVKDRLGRFTLVNQAVADVYGVRVEELLGKTDADFNKQSDEVQHFRQDDLFVIRDSREIKIAEEKITDAAGKVRILQTVKRPLRIPRTNEVHVLGVSTDITEQKHLQDQLLQAQKMEALGQLAGGVAHDFNNMMTGVLGYTALLKLECSDNPAVIRSSEMIERAATRAAELTQKLLGFARKGKHQEVPVDLHGTIRETLGIISRTVEKNITIVTDLKAANAFVLGDPVQVQQIILNLAINARDAMQPVSGGSNGGELRISTSINNEGPNITGPRNMSSLQSWLKIVVRDTGCGMPEEIKKKVFEPFFTTKGEGRGSGMGLAMVYGIVTNHGGSIDLDSSPGHGTTFTIWLPSTDIPAPLEIKVEQLVIPTSTTSRGTVLVVDDHEVAREATCEMLKSIGYRVMVAKDGVEALEYFEGFYQQIDLVLIDLIMPRMGAKECLAAMRERNPSLRAVLCTGYMKNSSVQEILADGVVGFLQKPYQLETLSRAINEVLTRPLPPIKQLTLSTAIEQLS